MPSHDADERDPSSHVGSASVRGGGAPRRSTVALVCLALTLSACPGATDRPRESQGSALEGGPGRLLYVTYCQSCHGPEGRGDGRAARALRVPPPDLTRLYERYGTPLDRAALGRYIDGRLLADFHGERDMPLWGEEFFADAPSTTPGLEPTREHLIQVLVAYLQSIQAEQPL